jgi:hypothetical protein
MLENSTWTALIVVGCQSETSVHFDSPIEMDPALKGTWGYSPRSPTCFETPLCLQAC